MKTLEIEPIYVEYMPDQFEQGKLYISKKFKVSIHLCACGCGVKTVTPIRDGEWTLTENDGQVSLHPSIGNWMGENPYHAHYFITDNKVIFV